MAAPDRSGFRNVGTQHDRESEFEVNSFYSGEPGGRLWHMIQAGSGLTYARPPFLVRRLPEGTILTKSGPVGQRVLSLRSMGTVKK